MYEGFIFFFWGGGKGKTCENARKRKKTRANTVTTLVNGWSARVQGRIGVWMRWFEAAWELTVQMKNKPCGKEEIFRSFRGEFKEKSHQAICRSNKNEARCSNTWTKKHDRGNQKFCPWKWFSWTICYRGNQSFFLWKSFSLKNFASWNSKIFPWKDFLEWFCTTA